MNKSILIKLFALFLGIMITLIPVSGYSSGAHLCTTPKLYGLQASEVNSSNKDFYCWEIKYLNEYHNRSSMDITQYINLFPTPWFVGNINILRQEGITPEKAEYLHKYFATDITAGELSDIKTIEKVLSKAEKHMHSLTLYNVKRVLDLDSPTSMLFGQMVSRPIFKLFTLNNCLIGKIDEKYFGTTFPNALFPSALKPVSVIGTTFINMFGEITGEIIQKADPEGIKFIESIANNSQDRGFGRVNEINMDNLPFINGENQPIYIDGNSNPIGHWNTKSCPLDNLRYELSSYKSYCLSCHIFEISFNTVSRVGYVMYDKLSKYLIDFMVVMFLLWTLFIFYETVIKKQDGFEFIKTFFNRSIWVFIIGIALSMSIESEHNILNYTIRPLTDFMVGYNETMVKGITDGKSDFKCTYADKNISEKHGKVIFSREIKENIVCTIERISAFIVMNFQVGKYNMQLGFQQFINLTPGGFTKLLIGLSIMAIFFYMYIMIPFYFIESFFMIALVVFLFPLFLVAYVFEKTKDFAKQGLDTFLFAIFQIISLTLMCSIISILMLYITGLDFYNLQNAISSEKTQEITSEILYILSFSNNNLLEVFYTGFVCWFLLGESLSIATKFSSIAPQEKVATTFFNITKNIVKYTKSITREFIGLKTEANVIADRIKRQEDKSRENSEVIRNLANERKGSSSADTSPEATPAAETATPETSPEANKDN